MDEELIRTLQHYLAGQLNDSELAQHYTKLLADVALLWKEDQPAEVKTDLIIAFAFGQRRDQNGNAFPDPVVSPRLKRLLHETAASLKCDRGYVQWEIAEADGPPIADRMKIVRPNLDPNDATANYLSTQDVCVAVVKEIAVPKDLTACVLAHRHHAWRCVQTVRSFGFAAWAPYEKLPDAYDVASAQPWCRSAERYLIHDLSSRLRWYQRKKLKMRSPAADESG